MQLIKGKEDYMGKVSYPSHATENEIREKLFAYEQIGEPNELIRIDRALEVIDSRMSFNGNPITSKRVLGSLKSIRKEILALKGGEQG